MLLDIRMPGMTGIEVARHLGTLENPPAIVFTTAYDEYALEAFESQAVGYLLKPVRRERLEEALKHASRLSAPQLHRLEHARAAARGAPARRGARARRAEADSGQGHSLLRSRPEIRHRAAHGAARISSTSR